jgi:hypothetical protein
MNNTPHGGRQYGHQHEHRHDKGHDPRHGRPRRAIAHHGERNHAGPGTTKALQDTASYQHFETRGGQADERTQRVKHETHVDGGLASNGIGKRPEDQRTEHHAAEETEDDQLPVIVVDGAKLLGDDADGRKHRVDRHGDHRRHHGDEGDEFSAWSNRLAALHLCETRS